ncbi:arginyl-tRNA synthetase [Rhodopseudomonas julia]|uniref:Arginine--tRNA ligase n=1 Tax=Rhodopseudomonas julia TaxID=200617 RepID=A0ABU0C968_9BRAD|nr:arginine--tRNA ligase [Rhodopseudomonas julia]MDQ0327061.1 arginyl-tRNA synthetase [Rhodopseudomonas julia]
MNLFDDFAERVRAAIARVVTEGEIAPELLARVVVEPPRDAAHGDLATNAALVLAKPLAMKPRDLATRLGAELSQHEDVDAVEIAGPGFLNLRLAQSFWARELAAILKAGDRYGYVQPGQGAAVNIEYVSANPTGPLHVGHCRGAVVGDAIANLLAASGQAVSREYYINDAGSQVDQLARSVHLRYREALGETVGEIPKGLYPGDYLVPVGKALAEKYGDALRDQDEGEWLPLVRDFAIAAMMENIREDLASLNIRHDVFFSERSLIANGRDRVAELIGWLEERDLVYWGTLPPPKGQENDDEDWDEREQLLFRATLFGDDVDRPLKKADGSYTYFASDIAYHFDKFERGFAHMIDVWGADHGGYVKRMTAAVKAISEGKGELEVQLSQLVRLFRAGEPVRMSKRAGDLVTLADVVDEVGRDAVRFMMLTRKADAPLDFDFQTVTEQSKDNPVFYVQYAHARTASVRRQFAQEMPEVNETAGELASIERLLRLEDPGELQLIKHLCDWPRIVQLAAQSREPHRIAYYLYDLANSFHVHWNKGKESPQLRFIKPDDVEISKARLGLVDAVGMVIRAGLSVLGVEAPKEMR